MNKLKPEVKYFVVFRHDELTAIERVNRHSVDVMTVCDNWDGGHDDLIKAKRFKQFVESYNLEFDVKIIKVIKNWSIENVYE